jgi:anti-sigma regulatory factor (Ser/Thr protein kinase)
MTGELVIMEREEVSISINCLEILIISILTYYIAIKISNTNGKEKNRVLIIILFFIVAIICAVIKKYTSSFYSIICLNLLLSLIFYKREKKDVLYSIMMIEISLSINYILLFLAGLIAYFPNKIFNIKNDYIQFISIMLIHIIFSYNFTNIKRFKNGIIFFKNKIENEYFNLIILNISIAILFFAIIISNYNEEIADKVGIGFIIFSIIMFITIQKSLQLYYKQRLLVQDLEETKKELEDKKKEIKQLEQENLNFSKTSHSIAHKQKALEYKLNELALKNEIAEEIDVKNRLNNITKQISEEPEIEIPKTNISEIDDMLNYMKSECIKNKIKFEVQLNGNIYQMINNHITKEELEILIADHVKNAIIAVKCSNNSNRSILVRIGKIDGQYSIYIYDSGIEFEINTLHKLGKIPSTTHKESGGTGMGFMNTFDTLKKHKASITINEYGKPAKDNYTKVIMIVFNKKDEFNIISYRQKEIEVRKNKINV